jgi:aldose 1-epimerase
MDRINLASHGYALSLAPETGGGVVRFAWEGEDIFRPARGGDVLDSGCFPLVPFSNRIAGSRFAFGGEEICLAPNHPHATGDPVLHGFGWLAAWAVEAAEPERAVLRYDHLADAWPWGFTARASFALDKLGLLARIELHNRSARAMPAGLGFHPFFPRTASTRYIGWHRGEWEVDADCLPLRLDERSEGRDWWDGQPADTRIVDTAFVGRTGPLRIEWPERGVGAVIAPSEDLNYTVVYVPAGEDYLCVEPVSHATDALNRDPGSMRILGPDKRWSVSMRVSATRL